MARPPPPPPPPPKTLPTTLPKTPPTTLPLRCCFRFTPVPTLDRLLLCLLILLQLFSAGIAMSDEKRLIKYLLDNYERVGIVGRPVYNTSETVRVNYGLALIQILDLDEKNQVLTTNVWSRYEWTDVLLLWNPADYGGVTQVRVPADEIWTPDIVLYNYADARLNEQREALAVVSANGAVLWIPMSIFRSTCSIDITNFPFDIQTCIMKFGSWTYDGFKLNLEFYADQSEVDVTDYIKSNEWDLLDHPAVRNVKYYPCCVEPYIDLTFHIRLKRIGAFYSYILILPCVLLSVLTLVVFWLPPESSAKMVIGMNIFVAFFLLLRILAASTPPAASSIPLLGAYFCLNMFLITMSTFLAVVVINLYFRQDKKNKVPKWLKRLFIDGLARVFFMHGDFPPTKSQPRTESHTLITHIHGRRKASREKRKIKSPILQYNKWEPPPPATTMILHESPIMGHRVKTPENSPLHTATIVSEVREIRRALRSLQAKVQARDAHALIVRDWRVVALVVDRLFFFIYVVTIIVALITMFPKS